MSAGRPMGGHSWLAAGLACLLLLRAIAAGAGVAEALLLEAAERRLEDSYALALLLEAVVAFLASITVARFAWRSVRDVTACAGRR